MLVFLPDYILYHKVDKEVAASSISKQMIPNIRGW